MAFPLFVAIASALAAVTVGAVALCGQRRTLAAALAILGSAALLLLHGRIFIDHFPVDDAYITFRYSKNLADGVGPTWNSTGTVEGYTNFLWVALPAGLSKLGIDLIEGARAMTWAFLLATLGVVYLIWKLWADEHRGSGLDSPVVLAAALLALGLNDSIAFWGFSGMETPLIALLLTGGAYLYLLERRSARFPWSAVAFAAAAMTRPEAIVAAGVTGAFTMADAWRLPDRRDAIIRVASWAGLFIALYGSYFLWRYTYYDYLFPNTFYAKSDLTRDVVIRGFNYVNGNAFKYHLLPLLAGMVALVSLPKLRQDALYITTLCVAMLMVVAVEGGEALGHARFLAPLLPLFFITGLAGLATLLKRLSLPRVQNVAVAAIVLTLGGMMLLSATHNSLLEDDKQLHAERRELGLWLERNTPDDYTIAAFAVGSIAYHSERDILDLFGINDVVIAHTDVPDFGRGIAGHEKYNANHVFETVRPELIIVPLGFTSGPITIEELQEQFSDPNHFPAVRQIMRDFRVQIDYTVLSLPLGERWWHILQRRDTIGEFTPAELPR